LSASRRIFNNVHYYLDLMRRMRDAIARGGFERFKKDFYGSRGSNVV
jgi:queuine/archaeosine tRNA-ribosyltransferase